MIMYSDTQLCPTLCNTTEWSLPWNSGTGCHFLLQGIFLTQGLNRHLSHSKKPLHHWALSL